MATILNSLILSIITFSEIFLDILEIIRVESDDLQKYALETLGACADKSTDCQIGNEDRKFCC